MATFGNTVSINALEDVEQKISLYPNPAKNTLTISSKDHTISNIKIFDLMGKMVYNTNPNTVQFLYTLDVSGFKNGLYNLKIYAESGECMQQKITICR
jgi:hypothetical protein